MRSLLILVTALFLLSSSCGPDLSGDLTRQIPSLSVDTSASWSATCREVTCEDRVYSLDEIAAWRCQWDCVRHEEEWKQVTLTFESDGTCFVTDLKIEQCWGEWGKS